MHWHPYSTKIEKVKSAIIYIFYKLFIAMVIQSTHNCTHLHNNDENRFKKAEWETFQMRNRINMNRDIKVYYLQFEIKTEERICFSNMWISKQRDMFAWHVICISFMLLTVFELSKLEKRANWGSCFPMIFFFFFFTCLRYFSV